MGLCTSSNNRNSGGSNKLDVRKVAPDAENISNARSRRDAKEQQLRKAEGMVDTYRVIMDPTSRELCRTPGEHFMDSAYLKNLLNSQDSDEIYRQLLDLGLSYKQKNQKSLQLKSPLLTISYGCKRRQDEALAFDRCGSCHESWLELVEPNKIIENLCEKIRDFFFLADEEANSIEVDYYWNGTEQTFLPANKANSLCLETDR